MGGSASLALGIAIAQPDIPVLCLTGDGEMLMGIGSLATVAVEQPKNLSIVVLDNEHYGETGMQRTHTGFGVDLAGVARAMGFPTVLEVNSMEEVAQLREALHAGAGPLFALVKVDPEKLPLVLPPRETAYLKSRFRIAVLGEGSLQD
jgi:thiamine pyrophosphate-dependent acetolactate synthase large subunit-like protein